MTDLYTEINLAIGKDLDRLGIFVGTRTVRRGLKFDGTIHFHPTGEPMESDAEFRKRILRDLALATNNA